MSSDQMSNGVPHSAAAPSAGFGSAAPESLWNAVHPARQPHGAPAPSGTVQHLAPRDALVGPGGASFESAQVMSHWAERQAGPKRSDDAGRQEKGALASPGQETSAANDRAPPSASLHTGLAWEGSREGGAEWGGMLGGDGGGAGMHGGLPESTRHASAPGEVAADRAYPRATTDAAPGPAREGTPAQAGHGQAAAAEPPAAAHAGSSTPAASPAAGPSGASSGEAGGGAGAAPGSEHAPAAAAAHGDSPSHSDAADAFLGGPAETDKLPVDGSPAVAASDGDTGNLGALAGALETAVAKVLANGEAAASGLAASRGLYVAMVEGSVATQRSAILAEQTQQAQQIDQLAEREKGAIGQEQSAAQAGLDAQQAADLARMQQLFLQHEQQLRVSGDQSRSAVVAQGQTAAQNVSARATQAAAQALRIGQSVGSQYQGSPKAGQIASMAQGAAQQTATQLQQDLGQLAASLRSDAQQIGAKLAEAGQSGASSLQGQLSQSQQALRSSYRSARDGIVTHANNARGQVDRNREQARGQLAQVGRQLVDGLGRVAPAVMARVDQAIQRGQSQLRAAAKQQAQTLRSLAGDASQALFHPGPRRNGDAAGPDPQRMAATAVAQQLIADAASAAVQGTSQGAKNISQRLTEGTGAVGQKLSQLGQQGALLLGQVVDGLRQGLSKLRSEAQNGFRKLTTEAGGARLLSSLASRLTAARVEAEGKIKKEEQAGSQHLHSNEAQGMNAANQYLTNLTTQVGNKAKELNDQSLLGAIWDGIASVATAIGGLLWGVLKSIGNFILSLAKLILKVLELLALLIAAVLVVFLLVALFLGAEVAGIVALICAAIGILAIALYVAFEIIKGIIMTVIGICQKLYKAFTDESLTLFERFTLIGEALGDVLLLLLPFKAKIKAVLRGSSRGSGVSGTGGGRGIAPPERAAPVEGTAPTDPVGGTPEGPGPKGESPAGEPQPVPADRPPGQKPGSGPGETTEPPATEGPEKTVSDEGKGQAEGGKSAPRSLAELEGQLTPKAKTALEQLRELLSPDAFQKFTDNLKNADGAYDVAKAISKLEQKYREPADFQKALDERTAHAEQTAQEQIKKIENCVNETNGKNRPNAKIGDGTTEAALDWETQNGKPIVTESGHPGKVANYINAIQRAIDLLEKQKRLISDAELLKRMDQAIADGKARIEKMQPALDRWNNRVADHPDVWNPDGTSKVEPSFPKP